MNRYTIGWRGIITRDIGTDTILAVTRFQAQKDYEALHPNREVTNVYLSIAQ